MIGQVQGCDGAGAGRAVTGQVQVLLGRILGATT